MFDKPLFQDKTANTIYNVKEFNEDDDAGEGNNVEKMLNRGPNRGFEGTNAAEKKTSRNKPVEFEKHVRLILLLYLIYFRMMILSTLIISLQNKKIWLVNLCYKRII